MTMNVTLFIGSMDANYAKFRFTDPAEWERVRAQIVSAMDAGKGLIELSRKGDNVVYVYSPFLAISWIESGS